MISFNNIPNNLNIRSILTYTYQNNITRTRFEYSDRDVLPSRFKIAHRKLYKKNKHGEFSTPQERLIIMSTSAPQYKPYIYYKGKRSIKQMKIKHTYDITMCIQPINDKHEYSLDSKIVYRCGSFKKWNDKPPQKMVKTIYRETREKLNIRFSKYLDCKERVQKYIDKIKRDAKYLDVGDYNAQELGIMGDSYFRSFYVQQKLGCLYGNSWYKEPCEGIDLPFFNKHELLVIATLIKRGIIKA